MIPAWLQRHLEATGQANPDGVGRHARASRCPRCGDRVLAGLDDNRCALPARVDPRPVSRQGELAALILGLRTYDLLEAGGRLEITQRDQFSTGSPDRRWPVMAEHRCGVVLDVDLDPPAPNGRGTYVVPEVAPY